MKLVSFVSRGRASWGAVTPEGIRDVGAMPGAASSLKAALPDLSAPDLSAIAAALDAAPLLPLASVSLLPPIPDPAKILCVGLNYKSHIAETGREAPRYPMLFPRYPDSLVGSGAALVRPSASHNFDFEGELAVVIGKAGRHIAVADALGHVAGYACFNDGSIRDWQRHTTQFLPGKNFAHSGSFGPWLVTVDEAGDIGALHLETRLNGEVMQRARLDDLLFPAAELIAYISTMAPLQPGHVIATGTTGGVGLFRDPPVWMKPGDTITVEIERLGTLANTIIDEEPGIDEEPAIARG